MKIIGGGATHKFITAINRLKADVFSVRLIVLLGSFHSTTKIRFKKLKVRLRIPTDSFCKVCGRDVHDFISPDHIWDAVEPNIKHGTVLCYDCFCEECKKLNLPAVWRLVDDQSTTCAPEVVRLSDPCVPSALIGLLEAETLARRFHDTYERLAIDYGYETRKASRTDWENVPENNRKLMVAVCSEILSEGF